MTQAYSEKGNPSAPIRSRTQDLPTTSSDALPLSYRRLAGAKAIKLVRSIRTSNRKVLHVGSTPDSSSRISFFRVCLCHLLNLIHHSHSFTRLKKYSITFLPLRNFHFFAQNNMNASFSDSQLLFTVRS